MAAAAPTTPTWRNPVGFVDNVRPTTYMQATDIPYVLTGGQIVMISIDTDERSMQASHRLVDIDFAIPQSTLSVAQTSASPEDAADSSPDGRTAGFSLETLMTPLQREHFAWMKEFMGTHASCPLPLPALPKLRMPPLEEALPLSLSLLTNTDQQGGIEIVKKSDDDQEKTKAKGSGSTPSDESAQNQDESSPKSATEESTGIASKVLLTKKQASWVLSGQKDFMRGKHLGTDVTSKGNLVLAPKVRALYRSTEMVPAKLATAGDNIYLAGWKSDQVIRIDAQEHSDVFFPKQGIPGVKTVTALATDADGNVLVGSWPDQRVRQFTPEGTLTHEWSLPGTKIWDIVVASDGKRYAACDQGTLYLLHDDAQSSVQVACSSRIRTSLP